MSKQILSQGEKNICPKTLSGKHCWMEAWEGFLIATFYGIKCKACGMYKE